jgi:hypothetical protein
MTLSAGHRRCNAQQRDAVGTGHAQVGDDEIGTDTRNGVDGRRRI